MGKMMNKKIKITCVTAVILLSLIMLSPGTTNAQQGPLYYAMIKIQPITDNVQGGGYIPIISYEYAEQNTAAGNVGKKASKVEMADIRITKIVDENSPKIFLACAKGEHLPNVWIHLYASVDESTNPVIELWLWDVWVSSYMTTGRTGDDLPEESFTLGYSTILYTAFNNHKGWNIPKNAEM
jgi:type VI secretion system Hcp family effector